MMSADLMSVSWLVGLWAENAADSVRSQPRLRRSTMFGAESGREGFAPAGEGLVGGADHGGCFEVSVAIDRLLSCDGRTFGE